MSNSSSTPPPPISSILSAYSNFVLDHYVRPTEITNCLFYAPNSTPQQCACALSGVAETSTEPGQMIDHCEKGYQAGAVQATNGDSNQGMVWCLNNIPKDLPQTVGVKIEGYQAWLAGCFSGVTGPDQKNNS